MKTRPAGKEVFEWAARTGRPVRSYLGFQLPPGTDLIQSLNAGSLV